MRPKITALLLGLLTVFGLCLGTGASATDVDGPNDCLRTPTDFGDAPEDLFAYPGILGHFPTCLRPTAPGTQEIAAGCQPISSPPGVTGFVRHWNGLDSYWLGCSPLSVPMGIDPESDGKVSLNSSVSACYEGPVDCMESAFGLTFGQDECWGSDDAGVQVPSLRTCAMASIKFVTNNCGPGRPAYLNILLDMNQDGDWNDAFMCASGACAYEWAIVNVPIQLAPGCTNNTSPSFLVGPNAGHGWLRVTICDQPVSADFPWAGSATMPNQLTGGETEDYPVEIEPSGPCDIGYEEYGDAPEDVPAYASGAIGHFPTCVFPGAPGTQEIQCGVPMSTAPGPTGFVRHRAIAGDPVHFWLGCPSAAVSSGVDSESDGKMDDFPMPPIGSHCNAAVIPDCVESLFGMTFAQDECYGDGVDAGVSAPIEFVACSTGVVAYTAFSCSPVDAYLNVLVDWNEDGDWNDNLLCSPVDPTQCAYEWVVKNATITLAQGCQTLTSPQFLVGPRTGRGWLRISLTQDPVCDAYPWNGSACWPGEEFRNGETEDYPVSIREPAPQDPCHSGWEDFGDAPEDLQAYPPGAIGHFPTCIFPSAPGTQEIQCGAPMSTPPGLTGYVQHVSLPLVPPHFWLGCPNPGPPWGIDREADGKVSLFPMPIATSYCNPAVPIDCTEAAFGLTFGQDECTNDLVDAGILGPVKFNACSVAVVRFSAFTCTPAQIFLNILVDWNGDGDWNDNLWCGPPYTPSCAYEWAVKNLPIALVGACQSVTSPPFRTGPISGPSWMRVTLTRAPVGADFPWSGSALVSGEAFEGGETEDYPVWIDPSVVGVEDRPRPGEMDLAVTPNPSREGADIRFALPRESEVEVSVYDVAGRQLRGLLRGSLPAGEHSLRWDFRTDDGTQAPIGLYLVKLRAGDRVVTRTLIRIQ